MMRLESDLPELLLAYAENRLASLPAPSFSPDTALTVVMAADGYPGTPAKGGAIRGIEAARQPAPRCSTPEPRWVKMDWLPAAGVC